MPQPKLPRKFKFVGGPSRKRRRGLPPAVGMSATTTATNDKQTSMKPISVLHAGSSIFINSSPEANDGYIAHSSAPSDEDAENTTRLGVTSFADEPQVPLATGMPHPTEVLESLLNWPASTGLSIATDASGSALEFNDPFSLFGAPFHLATSPGVGLASGAAPEPPLDSLSGYLTRNQGPSVIGDIPSGGLPKSSTEDILGETDPELGDHRSIPQNIGDSYNRLFAQYDREFCVWPLTHDFEANPFRYDIETGQGSPLLWHSILALSYKHVHRETGACLAEARVHKRKAVQLLGELEGDFGSAKSRANLLNGLLILMTLDCATSAQGPWVAHLRRAQKIIEALEVFRIQRTPKIQAQINMLVWWDVTLGLTTRQGFVLSPPAIRSVFGANSNASTSTFYNISGCPEELFRYMFQLGTYAREFELASHMTCVTFDMAPVLAVERAVREWRALQYDDPDTDLFSQQQPGVAPAGLPDDWEPDSIQAAHYVQDLYHCAQAWRFALLVYIERVFKWRQRREMSSPARMSVLARQALNHVISCRRTIMVQKQLLLPVFLAACETDDEGLREAVRDYCNWWGVRTRYDMFVTTLGLLEEVWSATGGDQDTWWGELIDQKSGVSSTKQYLFG